MVGKGLTEVLHSECTNTIEIHHEIMFDFYLDPIIVTYKLNTDQPQVYYTISCIDTIV